ncbi:MAG: o-succinylbenzoate--CoA ligase [Salinivenus sp.]
MLSPLQRHARARPAAPALVGPDRDWSYADLCAAVEGAARRMRQAGIKEGDRVALRPTSPPEAVVLLWALWHAGAVAVPLSPREPVAAQQAQAEQVACRAILAGEAADASFNDAVRVLTVPAILEGSPSADEELPAWKRDRDATILFTSGSTGRPKAALHSWANHLYNAKGANANLPLRAGDRWLLSLPLYHVGGLAILVRCALAGAAVVVPGRDDSIATALVETRATHVSCVATQLRRVLATSPEPPPVLRAMLLGGGPVPAPLLDRAHAHGWPLLMSYGCTEMASQVTTTMPGASRSALRTAGSRLPHRRLRIGGDGQIRVAGRCLFRGYVEDGTIVDPRTDRGWYPTGDRGRIDARGRLHVLGRVDRMFISGGENIQPEEVETALEELSGVTRAVVVPVSSAEYGRRPVAFIERERSSGAEDVREGLRGRLPGFKIPDAVYPFPEDVQRREEMKIDREALRQWAEAHTPGAHDAGAGQA